MITLVERVCEMCGTAFSARPIDVSRGRSRFCSMSCSSQRRKPLRQRFEEKLGKPNERGCILWPGSLDPNGRGQISLGSKSEGMEQVHRVSWELYRGPIPDGLWVLHKCDVRHCVNPDHLFLGDHEENMADMTAKMRQAFGERNAGAKLTEEEAKEVIRLYRDGGMTQTKLAALFNVHQATISSIVSGKTWRYLCQ